MSKIFEFKDDLYSFEEIFDYHKGGKNLYKVGVVTNVETGDDFDISDVYKVKSKYYEVLNDVKEILKDNKSRREIWALNETERDKRIKELNSKYSKGTINLEDIELLLRLEKGVKPEHNYYVTLENQGTFYKKNHRFKYPEGLSKTNIGNLHLLLDFMTYDNEIKRTPHNKALYPTIDELLEFMRLKDSSALSRVLTELKKHGIIEHKRKDGKKIIYINPLFSTRNLKIHPELYKRFKDSLDEVLSPKEVKYLELLTFKDSDRGSIVVSE
jgi:hypothetical protein